MVNKSNEVVYSFPHFSGFTTKAIVNKHSKAAHVPGFAKSSEKVLSIFPMRKFLELSVVLFAIQDFEDSLEGESRLDRYIQLITLEDDPNLSLLLEYRSLLTHALMRTMNQGILNERKQVNELHIDAARNIIFETNMRPEITLVDLPSLEDTGGLTNYQRGFNRYLNKYDRSLLIDRFD